ncbi:MAG: universal stress protein, partial [Alkalilacustris sp.]
RARLIAAADIEVTTRLRRGDPAEVYEEILDTTRFALIGKRGEDASGEMVHLGSNLERLVRASTRPVMVVSRAFRPVERVLIAVDGGPSATRAVERVCESPLLRGADVHLLTVGGDPARLTAAADRLRAAGFTVQTHHAEGTPEDAISQAVRDHDIGLLVLGKSGHSRLRQLFIGSTTLDLMRNCQVPVLIFP